MKGKEKEWEDSTFSRHSGTMAQLKTACPQGRSQRNLKAHCNLIIPFITLGQKEIHVVYKDKIERESGLIKILVPKKKRLPGGSVVGVHLPMLGMSSIPASGRFHMLWGSWAAKHVLCNKRSRHNEKPKHCNQRVVPACCNSRKPMHSHKDPMQPKN